MRKSAPALQRIFTNDTAAHDGRSAWEKLNKSKKDPEWIKADDTPGSVLLREPAVRSGIRDQRRLSSLLFTLSVSGVYAPLTVCQGSGQPTRRRCAASSHLAGTLKPFFTSAAVNSVNSSVGPHLLQV
ncbi:unnamed protein product [Pleuronectes platessa]|uniref:Uncharacterized protein n=1 Tax=Pleuronectes platessa TaxID=8262 RepID=A0A9N7VEA4_PLEPL|nr:unnamed protein product [Pleuronectes platessa]